VTTAPPRPRRVAQPVIPQPAFRTTPALLAKLWRDRLALMSDAAEEFGDAVRFRLGPKTLYFFNHPDHAKHVLADNAGNYHKGIGLTEARRVLGDGLLTSEGEQWRRHRRAVQPAFRRERVAGFSGVVVDETEGMLQRLDGHVGHGTVDMAAEMTRLTLRVLGRALLDADLAAFTGLGAAFDVVQGQAMFEMVTLGAVPGWLPLRRNRRFRAARRELTQIVSTLVTEHGASDGGDVISLLVRSGIRDLHDELVTILLAGHETTASTLSWTWYLLSRHPEAERLMRAEAAAVLGDRVPRQEDVHRLEYTTMVIQEAMRLYPPVWALPRRAVGPDEVGGHRVPAGADVMICPYTLHRHPEYWVDPHRFDPYRFDASASGPGHRYAYIPFGAGPRVCVGSHLGMMEAVLVAAMVARRFRLRPVGDGAARPEANLSLRVRGGLPVSVERV
jgi:enediyne biosynthesis protein E7